MKKLPGFNDAKNQYLTFLLESFKTLTSWDMEHYLTVKLKEDLLKKMPDIENTLELNHTITDFEKEIKKKIALKLTEELLNIPEQPTAKEINNKLGELRSKYPSQKEVRQEKMIEFSIAHCKEALNQFKNIYARLQDYPFNDYETVINEKFKKLLNQKKTPFEKIIRQDINEIEQSNDYNYLMKFYHWNCYTQNNMAVRRAMATQVKKIYPNINDSSNIQIEASSFYHLLESDLDFDFDKDFIYKIETTIKILIKQLKITAKSLQEFINEVIKKQDHSSNIYSFEHRNLHAFTLCFIAKEMLLDFSNEYYRALKKHSCIISSSKKKKIIHNLSFILSDSNDQQYSFEKLITFAKEFQKTQQLFKNAKGPFSIFQAFTKEGREYYEKVNQLFYEVIWAIEHTNSAYTAQQKRSLLQS